MGMMDSMMQGMIKALPVEDRKALMLKMMPDYDEAGGHGRDDAQHAGNYASGNG